MHRRRRSIPVSRAALALAPFVLILAAGCARQTTSPIERSLDLGLATAGASTDAQLDRSGNGPPTSYVDLRPGRETRIERHFRVRITPTGGATGAWETFVEFERESVVGTQARDGYEYVVVKEEIEGDPDGVDFDLFRADRSGLYRRDDAFGSGAASLARAAAPESRGDVAFARALAGSGAAAGMQAAWVAAWSQVGERAAAVDAALSGCSFTGLARTAPYAPAGKPGGAIAEEVTLLQYPFRPGNQWEVRVGFNVWTVEGVELLETDAGRFHVGRLNIDLPLDFGPNDRATTWWGAPGEVARVFHAEGQATDDQGNVIGTVEADETVRILSYTPGAGR